MENLNLDQFNPQKAQIIEAVKLCETLTINGIDDKEGYAKVDAARKELKRYRNQIQNTGKAFRADAILFQKSVIALENELVAMIEPTEKRLNEMQDAIIQLTVRERRRVLLPERLEKLAKIEETLTEDQILDMDEPTFLSFYNNKLTLINERREQELKEKEDAIRREQEEKDRKEREERLEEERAKQREIDMENARIAGEEKAKRDLIAKQKADEEEAAKKLADEKRAEQSLKRTKLYKEFLEKCGVTKENIGEFKIVNDQTTGRVDVYKLIDSIIIK